MIAAGALDLIENAALWGVIARPAGPSEILTGTAGVAAAVKFVLVLAAIGFVVAFGLGRALARVSPLVQWFLSAPVLVLIAALVLAVLWRVALASLGIPDLFWSESAFMQVLAGVGVGALLGHLGTLGFLLDTQRAAVLGRTYRSEWSARIVVAWVLRLLPNVKRSADPARRLPAAHVGSTARDRAGQRAARSRWRPALVAAAGRHRLLCRFREPLRLALVPARPLAGRPRRSGRASGMRASRTSIASRTRS